jgi:hypothetical protein
MSASNAILRQYHSSPPTARSSCSKTPGR